MRRDKLRHAADRVPCSRERAPGVEHATCTVALASRGAGALLFYRLEWAGQRAQGKFVVLN